MSLLVYSLILTIFSILTWTNLQRQRQSERIFMVLLTTIPNAINQMDYFYTRTISKDLLRS
ncbi:hypothetical protein I4U23_005842 [Adineta vaga]|nr:hypothetical protein I4U23_005842 [Adineta vaga]